MKLMNKFVEPYADEILFIAAERKRYEDIGQPTRAKYNVDFKPEDFKGFVTTTDELLDRIRGKSCPTKDGQPSKKQLTTLAHIGWIAKAYQPITSNYFKTDDNGIPHEVSIISIASTSNRLIRKFGSHRQVSRVLSKCREVGLIQCVSESVQFKAKRELYNHSKFYAWNKSVEHLVLTCCRDLGIDCSCHDECEEEGEKLGENSLYDIGHIENIPGYDQVTLKTRRIGIKHITDQEAISIIQAKYNAIIRPRLEKIAEMNATLPDELKIRFTPNVKRDRRGYISTIGYRATNMVTSLKAHKNENTSYKGKWRKDYLREHFGTSSITAFDVRASIFQISHLLNFGEWLGNFTTDPYALMLGCSFKSKTERDAYKSFAMPLYFDNPSQIFHHNKMKLGEVIFLWGEEKVKEAIQYAVATMRRFTGEPFHNEVFLHESLLYTDFAFDLYQRGLDVVQIYDGFYLRGIDANEYELEELLRKHAIAYQKEYEQWASGNVT